MDTSPGEPASRVWRHFTVSADRFRERFKFILRNSVPVLILATGVLICFLGILIALALAGRSYLIELGWTDTAADLGLAGIFLGLAILLGAFALPSVFAIRREALTSDEAPEKLGDTSRILVEDLSRAAKEKLRPSALLIPHANKIVLGATL